MAEVSVSTIDRRTAFLPGAEVEGVCAWQLDRRPDAVEVRLFWYTQGKGTVDAQVVDKVRFEGPPSQDRRQFRLTLPDAPHSFSGKLISLLWALELVVEPTGETDRLELTMSPTGSEILLHKADEGTAQE
jgi:hypothetical protein